MTEHSHHNPHTTIDAQSETAEIMKGACLRFLDSLTPELLIKANLTFDSALRRSWHYVPREMFDRKGVSLKEMNSAQRTAAFKLLAAGLSHAGYEKVTGIMTTPKTTPTTFTPSGVTSKMILAKICSVYIISKNITNNCHRSRSGWHPDQACIILTLQLKD